MSNVGSPKRLIKRYPGHVPKVIPYHRERLSQAVWIAFGTVQSHYVGQMKEDEQRTMVLLSIKKDSPNRIGIGWRRPVAKAEFWNLLETDPKEAKKLADRLEDVGVIESSICQSWPTCLRSRYDPNEAAKDIAEKGLFEKLARRKATMLKRMASETGDKKLEEAAQKIESAFGF